MIVTCDDTELLILMFSFAIDGLSASGLRVILQPIKDARPDGYLRVLWGTKDPTNHVWMKSEVLYTYNKDHQVLSLCNMPMYFMVLQIFLRINTEVLID